MGPSDACLLQIYKSTFWECSNSVVKRERDTKKLCNPLKLVSLSMCFIFNFPDDDFVTNLKCWRKKKNYGEFCWNFYALQYCFFYLSIFMHLYIVCWSYSLIITIPVYKTNQLKIFFLDQFSNMITDFMFKCKFLNFVAMHSQPLTGRKEFLIKVSILYR